MVMNVGVFAHRIATKMRCIATMDIITAATREAIAQWDGVIVQLHALHLVLTKMESNGAIMEVMTMDVGWEIIAQLSAPIPLLLPHNPSIVPPRSFIAGEENMKTTAFQ